MLLSVTLTLDFYQSDTLPVTVSKIKDIFSQLRVKVSGGYHCE